jgi:D-alanyl-D-alanine carboxypeptidase/D-alanyl-D-alanine-endopeptidase (penicillin-binding protein 4)
VTVSAAVAVLCFAGGPAWAQVPTTPAPTLAQQLDEVGKSWLFRKATSGLQVVDLTSGEEVYAVNPDQLLNPASTMKVVTAAAALHHLGPAFRWSTDVAYRGTLDASGTLHGDLWVVGHGDPTFGRGDLYELVADLRLNGVRRIEGSVYFDDSYFAAADETMADPYLPGWNKEEDRLRGTPYFATLGALSLDQNTTVLVVGPGATVGSPATVDLVLPTAGYIEVETEITTTGAGTRKFVDLERSSSAEHTSFVVKGTFPVDDAERVLLRRTVSDPTGHFASAFQSLAQAQGLVVTGRWDRRTAPSDATVLMSHESAPLSTVLAQMNKNSLNFHAEQVLRTIGAELTGNGTTAAGLDGVRTYLGELGVADADTVLVNGSGLSREVRLKPSVLTAVMVDMARDPDVGSEFQSSLSIAGTDGTLWSRLRDDPGRLRGKTGTLDGVICLTGFLDDAGGRRYAFAFMANEVGSRLQAARETQDAFAREMFEIGGSQ